MSHLQTKLSHREGHEASGIRLEAMPLDQDIEGGHGERQARLKRRPYAVHDPVVLNVTLIGRPGNVETRQPCVVFRMQGKPPGPFPKGLPPVPNAPPLTWTVMVALRQWNRVKDRVTTNPEDQLILEGYPLMQGTHHVLLAQSCVSMLQQRAHKQAQQAAAPQSAAPTA